MRDRFKNHRRKLAVTILALLVVLVPLAVLASDLDVTSVVDAGTSESSITLAPGENRGITINMEVTGRQDHPATFEVNRNWELQADGTFVGSNPETHNVAPRVAQDPPTLFTSNGNVSVAAGVPAETYILTITPVVTSTQSPAALSVRDLAELTVIVEVDENGPSYAVIIEGFHDPVSMPDENGKNSNIVRGNRTVPLKFNLYLVEWVDEDEYVVIRELTDADDDYLGIALRRHSASCDTLGNGDDLAEEGTGKTGLRYDHGEGQWIHNWSTKGLPNGCYKVTLTADLADHGDFVDIESGSTLAYFNKQ